MRAPNGLWRTVKKWEELPCYLESLSSMWEIESYVIIPNGHWDEYVETLKKIISKQIDNPPTSWPARHERFWGNAQAEERARAALMVLKLWTP